MGERLQHWFNLFLPAVHHFYLPLNSVFYRISLILAVRHVWALFALLLSISLTYQYQTLINLKKENVMKTEITIRITGIIAVLLSAAYLIAY